MLLPSSHSRSHVLLHHTSHTVCTCQETAVLPAAAGAADDAIIAARLAVADPSDTGVSTDTTHAVIALAVINPHNAYMAK